MKLQFTVHQHSKIFLITNSRQWLIIHKVRVFIKMALANLHSFTFRYTETLTNSRTIHKVNQHPFVKIGYQLGRKSSGN